MKKNLIFAGTAVIALITTLTILLIPNQNVQAAWVFRNNNALNPVAACQDGIYIGLGAIQTVSDPYEIEATLQPGDETVFFASLTLPPNPIPNSQITHSGYYTFFWDEPFAPLPPGSVVELTPFSTGVGEFVTVGDCLVNPDSDPVSTAFTYQGRLSDGNSPANGSYDLQFILFNASQNGQQIGSPVSIENVTVVDGLFSLSLDFGHAAFNGSKRWLEIMVRPGDSTGNYSRLTPRRELTAVPYAHSLRAGAVISGSLANQASLTLRNNISDSLYIENGYRGVFVESAVDAGLWVNNSGRDGIYVNSATDDGIEINSANNWAGVFEGNIFVSGNCTGCLIAAFGVNRGTTSLQPGDIVTIEGTSASPYNQTDRLFNVHKATAGQPIVGVIAGMAEIVLDDDGQTQKLVARNGITAQPDEYVSIIIYGPVSVPATAANSEIIAGAKLTLAETGQVRAKQTVEVNGVRLAEDAPTLGIALDSLAVGESATIWVLVNPQ